MNDLQQWQMILLQRNPYRDQSDLERWHGHFTDHQICDFLEAEIVEGESMMITDFFDDPNVRDRE
ncbi:hypothetical protein [Haloterrigena salinisoli]|uniref:hypothetical protein n=1 Tax=Haloterrigena salinisoli TaxID=3132747 RepID=UPI0030CE68D3